MSPPTPARRVAYETLRRVFEEDAWADRALRAAARRAGLEGRERAQAQALAYGAVQRRGTCDHFIETLAARPPSRIDPPLLAALRLGLFELLFSAPGAEHAAVDQAVSLARGAGGRRHGAGLVNAVLRRAAREREALLGSLSEAEPEAAAIAHSVPPWLARLWWDELGAGEALGALRAINRPPERAFRVNELRSTTAEAAASLREDGVELRAGPPAAGPDPAGVLVVEGGSWGAVERAVAAGVLVPQSRGSALIVELLAPAPGERVLDLCAGPGIKASAIAAGLGSEGEGLVAVERDPGRARELRELLDRVGAGAARVIEGDASGPPPARDFDAVLVDPPCSGLGTLASRPDARWRRDPAAVAALAQGAVRILGRAREAARPGGRIVYSTCTISAAENEGVIAAAAGDAEVADLGAGRPGLAADANPRFLQTRPDRHGTDGFFAARLRVPAAPPGAASTIGA